MEERKEPPATPAQLAKAALRRLALTRQEPTPENYAAAYAAEAGLPAPAAAAQPAPQPGIDSGALAHLFERLVRSLERGGRQWTLARKKDSLQRVLAGNRSDAQRLLARLEHLVLSWDSDSIGADIDTQFAEAEESGPTSAMAALEEVPTEATPLQALLPALDGAKLPAWQAIGDSLGSTLDHALRQPQAVDGLVVELLADLHAAQRVLREQGANAERAEAMEALCQRARRLLEHRQHLFEELGGLCRTLSASLVDLAEDDSWARGQCEAMNNTIEQGLSARGVRSVSELLDGTRQRQRQLRDERSRARDSLKSLIQQMLSELGELGQHTDRFQSSVGRYAEAVEKADSLQSLAGTVREMMEEGRSVQALVRQTQTRLSTEHQRAAELSERVNELEGELKRLSDEVQTDQLTQIANRRGLIKAFELEQAKLDRETAQAGGQPTLALALALLDIDNFKRLNDSLGHAAGDLALKSLAGQVTALLRPGDLMARYGGEEFVLMLPATPLDEAQQVLTRLQRALTRALFMHEGKEVFVTFSAGITPYRLGEALETALDRADMALYEAKHTGKNRACVAP